MVHYEIKDLSFSYPNSGKKKALSNINLRIEQGQYVTICGKSGSGKSTLLKQLKTVLTPHGNTSGTVFFSGKPLKDADLREQSSKIGYVMQNPDNQIVTDKVWHELAFGLESLGMNRQTIRLRVAEMASYFGIQDWFHKNVAELSGGQKQLLNLASIMAMQPEVLILDEPTSQLDPIAASDFLNTIQKINRELGMTIIITEHRLEDIFYASDQVVVLEEGKIIADDRPRNIGKFLLESNNPMQWAMPTPVQISYGVPGSLQCPMTVREGAEWLNELLKGKTLRITRVDSKEEFVEEEVKNPVIELKEVWFRYERKERDILKGTSLKVPENTLYAIVGGNGTGKSTTLKTICGICRPYRGKVLIRGKKIEKYKPGELFHDCLSMLPQDPQSLFVKKTVQEELEEMQQKEDVTRLKEVIDICEIRELLSMHPYDLSGGEQQRVALAKVLLTNPNIILLDEPTKGMDNFFKRKFGEMMHKLKAQGVTIVIVSHDVEFCAQYADVVSMFFDGEVVTTNTPNRFFAKNSFYTTAANRMSRHIFENAVTIEDVIKLCGENL